MCKRLGEVQKSLKQDSWPHVEEINCSHEKRSKKTRHCLVSRRMLYKKEFWVTGQETEV